MGLATSDQAKLGTRPMSHISGSPPSLSEDLSPVDDAHVGQQDHVHHQGVDDGGDGHAPVVEDKGAGGHGDGLGCVLHAHLDNDGALLLCTQAEDVAEQSRPRGGTEEEQGGGQAQRAEVVGDSGLVLHEEDAGQQHQGREGQSGEHSLDLSGRSRQ